MSARDLDSHPDDADRRLVRAALAGDEGARAVLAERLRVVPLEVARLAGAGDPQAYSDRARRVLRDVARSLRTYEGEQDLEAWSVEVARRAIEPTGPADDPAAYAELIDVDAVLDDALPHSHARRPRGSVVDALRRARNLIRIGLVSTVLAIFFWADPQIDEEAGASADDVIGGDILLDYPVGAVATFDRFEWRGAGDEGYAAQVIVQADDGRTLSSPVLDTDTWTPRPGQLDAFGDRIRWEVQVRFEGRVERGWAYAWRDVR